jgi:hypothetical protein
MEHRRDRYEKGYCHKNKDYDGNDDKSNGCVKQQCRKGLFVCQGFCIEPVVLTKMNKNRAYFFPGGAGECEIAAGIVITVFRQDSGISVRLILSSKESLEAIRTPSPFMMNA